MIKLDEKYTNMLNACGELTDKLFAWTKNAAHVYVCIDDDSAQELCNPTYAFARGSVNGLYAHGQPILPMVENMVNDADKVIVFAQERGGTEDTVRWHETGKQMLRVTWVTSGSQVTNEYYKARERCAMLTLHTRFTSADGQPVHVHVHGEPLPACWS